MVFLVGEQTQVAVEPVGRGAGHDGHARVTPRPEVGPQPTLDKLGIEQPLLVPLLGIQGHDAHVRKRQGIVPAPPDPPRGMDGQQGDHVARGNPRPAKDPDHPGQGGPRVGGLVDQQGQGPAGGAAQERRMLPGSNARAAL